MATNTHSMIWYCTVHSKSSELGETGVFNSRLARNLIGKGGSVSASLSLRHNVGWNEDVWCRQRCGAGRTRPCHVLMMLKAVVTV